MSTEPVIICISNLNLRQKPPRYTVSEWLDAIFERLNHLVSYKLPIILVGGVIEAECPVWVLNTALCSLPYTTLAVAGEFDLGGYGIEKLDHTALYAMRKSHTLELLDYGKLMHTRCGILRIHGYHYGQEVKPCQNTLTSYLDVAVIAHSVWRSNSKFQKGRKLSEYKELLSGYRIALFGGNPEPFIFDSGTVKVANCGDYFYEGDVAFINADGSVSLGKHEWKVIG